MNLSNLLTAGRLAALACVLGAAAGFYDVEWGHQLAKEMAVSLMTGGLAGLGGGAYGVSQMKATLATQALQAPK